MGNSLNIENHSELIDYLQDQRRIANKTEVSVSSIEGGVSNRTVLLQFENGEAWVLKQALKKLRVAGDWFSSPTRIFREAEAMRWFAKYAPPNSVPKLIFEDPSQYLLAMEAVAPPFENLKTLLLTRTPTPTYFSKAGKLLGYIHQKTTEHPEGLPDLFQDDHFFQSLRVEPYYIQTFKILPETKSFFQPLISETNNDHYTLVHGDYSPKNLLVKDNRLILLDHEVVHFGDGTFDLGFFICHLLSKANHLPRYRSIFLDGILSFYSAYQNECNGMNQKRETRAVQHTIGCLLARVCGLSPLEYLTNEEQQTQKSIGLNMIKDKIATIDELIVKFKTLIHAGN